MYSTVFHKIMNWQDFAPIVPFFARAVKPRQIADVIKYSATQAPSGAFFLMYLDGATSKMVVKECLYDILFLLLLLTLLVLLQ